MPSFGNLFASLTLESASFMSGVKAAQKELVETQKTFARVGGNMQKVGAVLTVGITAPFVALAGAAANGAQQMAASVVEIERSAQLANVSTTEFQKLAYAAKSVGFESDKMADIYKDVNDKFGEFLATGGGEMKDFFENVAPKIGLTAEAFRGLSGPQALQLYYNSLQKAGLSQAQMTFYMEALANDAAALAPLLRDNGAAMAEMGNKAAVISPEQIAELKKYTEAQQEMEEATKKVTLAIASSGLLEAITSIITSVAELTGEFAKTSPEIFKWAVIIGGVGAALGPVIGSIGLLVTTIGAALPVLAGMSAGFTGVALAEGAAATASYALGAALRVALPWLGLLTGAVTAAYLAYQNWDQIKAVVHNVVAWMGDLYRGVKSWVVDKLNAVWDTVRAGVDRVKGFFFGLYDAVVGHSYVPDMVDEIGQHMARLNETLVKPAQTATQTAAEAFQALQQKVAPILDRLFPSEARMNQLREDIKLLEEYAKAGNLTAAQLEEAKRRARLEAGGMSPEAQQTGGVTEDMGTIGVDVVGLSKTVEDAWGRVQAANDNTVQSFADMARDIVGSLGNLGRSIKSGDWLGALQNVLDTIGQIAGLINGTGQPATRTFSTGLNLSGARAKGGPVLPYGDYLVGEKGPEILRMGGRRGSIIPNDQIGGPMAIHVSVEEGQLFRPVVRSESATVTYDAVRGNNRTSALRQRQALA